MTTQTKTTMPDRSREAKAGWRKVKLGALGLDISDGNYSSKYPKKSDFVKNGVPFIRADNIKDGRVVWSDMKYISPAKHHELQKGHLKKNDILVTTRGEIGKIARVGDEFIDSNINAQIVRINTKNILDSRYFFYYLWGQSRKGFFQSIQTGTALQQLPVGQLRLIDLELPEDITDQKRIAGVLSAFDDKIELNNKISVALEQMAQAIFKEWFVINDDSSIKRKEGIVKELGRVVTGKTPPTKDMENFGNKYPFITIPDMRELFVTNTERYLSDVGMRTMKNSILPAGSVCVSCIATVGLVCITTKESLTNQQINSIIPEKDIYRYFLYFFFKSRKQFLDGYGAGGTATAIINKTQFENMPVIIPDEKLLENFHNAVNQLFDRYLLVLQENQKLSALRDLLLPKLMRGEIRV